MPTAGILQFSKPIYRITESGEWLTERVQVLRTDGAIGNVSVKVTAKTETATVGKDIEKISQVLTWTDGDATPKFVDIKPIQDIYTEGDEFLILSLSGIKSAKYSPVKTSQLVIVETIGLEITEVAASLFVPDRELQSSSIYGKTCFVENGKTTKFWGEIEATNLILQYSGEGYGGGYGGGSQTVQTAELLVDIGLKNNLPVDIAIDSKIQVNESIMENSLIWLSGKTYAKYMNPFIINSTNPINLSLLYSGEMV